MNGSFDPNAAADRALVLIEELSVFFSACKAGAKENEKTLELASLIDEMADYAVNNDLLVDFRALPTAMSIVIDNAVSKQEKLAASLYERLLKPQVEYFKNAI